MDDQMCLFDVEENTNEKLVGSEVKLDVAKLEFIQGESKSWQELFSGYDSLKVITYSSGINFVCQVISIFEKAEIVFGCEQVMSYAVNEVMAFQTKLLEKIRCSKSQSFLIDRIKDNSLRLFVARKKLSHEKIYLLSSSDGRKRVIMGSANMSSQAFKGLQRENISYMDGDEAYEWYSTIYTSLKEESSDEISYKAVLVADDCENIEELPVSQTIKMNKVLEIVPMQDAEDKENIEFALDVTNLSAKIKPFVPKADKKGIVALSPTKLKTIQTLTQEHIEKEKASRKEYPKLIIDVENRNCELNDIKLDLNPTKEQIKNDVSYFLMYMNGYDKFHGNYQYMQRRYYEFANWFFCSPFMAPMRDVANRYNQNQLPYPIFGLVYGQSKAGKTSFLETLLKMMIGQKTRINAPDFTRKTIDALRCTVQGAPIIVDDLTQARFTQHAVETIKNDGFGVNEKMLNYPAVVISANDDVKAVSPEITRRTVICRVQAGLTNTEVMQSSIVKKVQKNIGTAFYREYLRRMLECVPELIESMKDDESESSPDILKISSEIIFDIFSEYSDEELPDYIRKLSIDDYFSEKVTGNQAIQTIKTAWKTSRECFVVNEKQDELRYNAGQSYEADRIIKELPENLEARKSRDWVVMNLSEAKQYFEIDFKKPFLDKIFKR